MRTSLWMSLLLLLVFGIGWTSRFLTESGSSGAGGTAFAGVPSDTEPRDRGDRDRDRDRRGPPGRGRGGPWSNSVQRFADRLGLDAEQQRALEGVMEDTRERVHDHEKAIWGVVSDSRRQMEELLRDDQRTLLDQLLQGERDQARDAEIAQSLEWMKTEAGLGAEQLVAVEAILRRFHEDLRQNVGSPFEQKGDPGSSWEKQFRERQEALHAELAAYLGAEDLERYKNRNHWMHGDRRPREGDKK